MKSFDIYEIYFLTAAFGCDSLFGLPALKDLNICHEEDIWSQTRMKLMEKHLLDENGNLIKEGYEVIKLLEEYFDTKSLTIINNLNIGFSSDMEYALILAQTNDEEYNILKIDNIMKVELLLEKLPIYIDRVPPKEELEFLLREIPMNKEVEDSFSSDISVSIQHFPCGEMTIDTNYESWWFTLHDNKMLALNMREDKLYRISQFYFLERLYTWLYIPFEKEVYNGNRYKS